MGSVFPKVIVVLQDSHRHDRAKHAALTGEYSYYYRTGAELVLLLEFLRRCRRAGRMLGAPDPVQRPSRGSVGAIPPAANLR
jgi:hypothetical protein